VPATCDDRRGRRRRRAGPPACPPVRRRPSGPGRGTIADDGEGDGDGGPGDAHTHDAQLDVDRRGDGDPQQVPVRAGRRQDMLRRANDRRMAARQVRAASKILSSRTLLRQRMIDDMTLRGFKRKTITA
jgi:hypothetical protein